MSDIRKYLELLESMSYYEYPDIMFRGELVSVTVEMHGGQIEDWWFTGKNSTDHKMMQMTQEEQEEVQHEIAAALEPAY